MDPQVTELETRLKRIEELLRDQFAEEVREVETVNLHGNAGYLRYFPYPYQLATLLAKEYENVTFDQYIEALRLSMATDPTNGVFMDIQLQPESAFMEKYRAYIEKAVTSETPIAVARAIQSYLEKRKAQNQ